MAPVAILATGQVLLLISGEIDLSVGHMYALAPFLMHYAISFYGVPVHAGDRARPGRRRAWSA